MKLSELLRSDLVVVPLRADDKWQAIHDLVARAVQAGAVAEARAEAVESALVARERSMTTGMEDGIAIPHAAVDDVEEVVAVLGLAPDDHGIPFEALDGKPARIVVCLIVPRARKLLHIRTLAGIAKLFARSDVRSAVLDASEPGKVIEVIARLERDA
jgi:mannitol/fructose-specific phosphotransferase system IIA component (Ntr-type)